MLIKLSIILAPLCAVVLSPLTFALEAVNQEKVVPITSLIKFTPVETFEHVV